MYVWGPCGGLCGVGWAEGGALPRPGAWSRSGRRGGPLGRAGGLGMGSLHRSTRSEHVGHGQRVSREVLLGSVGSGES